MCVHKNISWRIMSWAILEMLFTHFVSTLIYSLLAFKRLHKWYVSMWQCFLLLLKYISTALSANNNITVKVSSDMAYLWRLHAAVQKEGKKHNRYNKEDHSYEAKQRKTRWTTGEPWSLSVKRDKHCLCGGSWLPFLDCLWNWSDFVTPHPMTVPV